MERRKVRKKISHKVNFFLTFGLSMKFGDFLGSRWKKNRHTDDTVWRDEH